MKLTTAILTASLLAAPAYAATAEVCSAFENFAAAIMDARQLGQRLSVAMEMVETVPEEWQEPIRGIILDAYDRPQWHTESAKANAVERFAIDAGIKCWREQ